MDTDKYDLIFTGELVPGKDLAEVKRNLQALFRIDDAKVELLFSARSTVLKKGLDAEAANKYRVAIKKAGARIQLAPSASSAVTGHSPPKAPVHEGKAAGLPLAEVHEPPEGDLMTTLGAQPAKPSQPRQPIQAPDLPLAEPGADLLRAEERVVLPSVQVNLSGLSVAPQEGNLVRSEELTRPKAVAVDVPDLQVAPPGSDVLQPGERAQHVTLDLDLSGLNLADPGSRLAPEKPAAPPFPNVDHIKLQE